MKKVLVVDNHQSILDVMKTILEQYNYKVITAYSYKTILEMIKAHNPDIIILDIMLHEEDGRNICKQLKENSSFKNICIILFSASNFKLKGYKDYNADGILEKPFNMHDLLSVLNNCSKKNKQMQII